MAGCRDLNEQEPSEINTKNHPHFVDVKKDKLTVVYVGKGNHTDFGSVQSNVPAPTNRSVYYFEVVVLDPGARGTITIGLTDRSFLLNRQPGWEANSYGYRGEDGKKFLGSSRGEPYGPAFGKDDTVGCGIDYVKGLVFFTKNGVNLGPAGSLGHAPEYFPTLAMHSPNEMAIFRFSPPFAFDPQEIAKQNLMEERESIFQESIQRKVMLKLARSYIVSSGYAKTLKMFDATSELSEDELPKDHKTKVLEESAVWRQEVRCSIMAGEILKAIDVLETYCPVLFAPALGHSAPDCTEHVNGSGAAPQGTKAVAMLYSQNFVELIRESDSGEALKWLRQKMSPIRQGATPEVLEILRESCLLLASDVPADKLKELGTTSEEPGYEMFHFSRRTLCAELVNAACVKILLGVDERNPQDAWSPLQFALRHNVILRQAMHARNLDRGPVVCPRLLCCG
eukprot:GEMP01045486.1.p1 GENE.GEMP01045486.1~~GEMP01045486.1.p1  ORF type:complete len:453 (+),score=99.90 GEMP01045486.1:153-1511(+)